MKLPLRPTYPIFPGDGCIPFPSPRPREPTSEAQNFVERLWAFKTINELLKKSDEEEKDAEAAGDDESDAVEEKMVEEEEIVSADPPKKNSKQKALDLSLRYNFVTPLTSLVVTKPKKSDTEDGEEEEDPVLIVDPVPVRSGFGGYGGFFPRAGPPVHRQTAVFALGGPPGGAFGTRSSGSVLMSARRPGPRRPVLMSAGPPGPPGAYGRPSYAAAPPPRTTTFQPSLIQMSLDSADYFDSGVPESLSYFESSGTPVEESNTQPSTCDGSISLHDKTYLRGLNITVTDDMDDLTVSPSKIFQKLTSLEVKGDCCWTIFTEALFQGESKRFSPGASKSASDMGAVFRAAGSVKKSVC